MTTIMQSIIHHQKETDISPGFREALAAAYEDARKLALEQRRTKAMKRYRKAIIEARKAALEVLQVAYDEWSIAHPVWDPNGREVTVRAVREAANKTLQSIFEAEDRAYWEQRARPLKLDPDIDHDDCLLRTHGL
jgi:hypothetical protein